MFRLITVLFALVLVAAACGGDASTGAPTNAEIETDGEEGDTHDLVFPDPTVRYLQQALTDLGYQPGVIDGIYGSNTTEAVADFQEANDLDATGALDTQTMAAIESATGSDEHLMVESVQTQLVELGYYSDPVDGIWGADTEAAITEFQSTAGLETNGTLDQPTFTQLSIQYDQGVVDTHLDAAEASGVGGEVHDTMATVPDGSGDDYLQQGDSGPPVQEVQERLVELGYLPGGTDGGFGAKTASAILAFQKREGLQRDGIVGPEVLTRLDNPQGAGPQSSDPGPRVEIDLDRQILFFIDDQGDVTTVNTSTGSGKEFQSAEAGKGTVVAHTPVGEFTILRVIDGNREAPLGTLYRPMYFTSEGGFAIHGNPHVPAYPASHGCARVANWDMDYLWDQGLGVDDAVWVHGDNPPAPDNAAGGF